MDILLTSHMDSRQALILFIRRRRVVDLPLTELSMMAEPAVPRKRCATPTNSSAGDASRRFGQRPEQLIGLGAGDAAGDEELKVAPNRELRGDVEGVGDDRQAR